MAQPTQSALSSGGERLEWTWILNWNDGIGHRPAVVSYCQISIFFLVHTSLSPRGTRVRVFPLSLLIKETLNSRSKFRSSNLRAVVLAQAGNSFETNNDCERRGSFFFLAPQLRSRPHLGPRASLRSPLSYAVSAAFSLARYYPRSILARSCGHKHSSAEPQPDPWAPADVQIYLNRAQPYLLGFQAFPDKTFQN